MGSHEAMEPLRAHLESQMTVATMDRRVYLEDPLTPLNWEDEFADIAAVAASLGVDSADGGVDVFGHSAGALTVIGAAPGIANLRRLVLYEPPFRPPDPPAPSEAQLAAAQKMRSLLEADDAEGIFEAWFELVRPAIPDPEAWADARDELVPFSRSLVREMESDRSCVRPNQLDGLSAPTLYLVGEKTTAGYNRDWIAPLGASLADFRVQEIPGHGHLANFHAPELMAQIIGGFLLADL